MICVRGTHLALGGPKTQLYAGLWSGVEADLHAVRAIWSQSAGWTADLGVVEEEKEDATLHHVRAEELLDPTVDPGTA